MSESRRATWDRRYAEGDWTDEERPSPLLDRADRWLAQEGWALDVACGAGRNALHLARRGLDVLGVDLSVEGLRLLRRRARRQDLPVRPVLADVSRLHLRPGVFRVAVNVRFLMRDAFGLLRESLAPGGILVFETFHVDEIDLLGGDIRREYALERGELAAAFHDFEHLVYEEGVFQLEEGERGLARMVARKVR